MNSSESSATISLAKELISRCSITPDDAGCQEIMLARLRPLGFDIELLPFADVKNFWARKGSKEPVFCFAGHTDVVPSGPVDEWLHPPFAATLDKGKLYGRGAADMKGSLAAFITALERFIPRYPEHSGSIALLITSDEEGPWINGTTRVIDQLEARSEKIKWCLIGEPSSSQQLGDTIKNGRRGSLSGTLTVQGIQGHVAYPEQVKNPIHMTAPALAELAIECWDKGNEFFPPTSFQISNINAGTGATNVVPGQLEVCFNFRFSTEVTAEQLKNRTEAILKQHNLTYTIDWSLSGQPFITESGELIKACEDAILSHMGQSTQLSTSGGTSDGRFIAPTGAQVVELGPVNATIHKINEHVEASHLDKLSDIYESILVNLLVDS